MRNSSLNMRFKRPVHSPKHNTVNSQHSLRTFASMTLHIAVTQETMEIIDPEDTMIPTDIIKATTETAHDQLVASRDTSHEAQTDYESTQAIFLTDQVH